MPETSVSPDRSAAGLLAGRIDASRYDMADYDPHAVTGLMHGMMPGGVSVLDIGCGTGVVTLHANRDRNNRIVAVEPDAERAAMARSRGLDVRDAAWDESLQRTLGAFDVVMMADVLEHVPAPGEFLELARESLKPGGLLLLSVPNVAHWSVRWMLLRGRFDYQPYGIMDATHLRWFTRKTLRALLTSAGFEMEEMRYTTNDVGNRPSRGALHDAVRKLRNAARIRRTRMLPELFGTQFVVKARLRA